MFKLNPIKFLIRDSGGTGLINGLGDSKTYTVSGFNPGNGSPVCCDLRFKLNNNRASIENAIYDNLCTDRLDELD
jgi:hypothetical protein